MAENIAFSITIGGVDREIKTMQDLKKAIKDANNELLQAGEVGTQSYAEAQKKVTDLKDRLGDLGDAAKVQGTAVEKLGASTGLLGEGFKNLDLDKIKIGFKGIGDAIKANPLMFLIGIIIPLLEKFKVFELLIGGVSKAFDKLTDSIGFTNHKDEEASKSFIENKEKEKDAITQRYDAEITLAKAAGKDVSDLEKQKAIAIEDNLAKQILSLNQLLQKKGELNDEELKKYQQLQADLLKVSTDRQAREIQKEKEYNEKIYQERKSGYNLASEISKGLISNNDKELLNLKENQEKRRQELEKTLGKTIDSEDQARAYEKASNELRLLENKEKNQLLYNQNKSAIDAAIAANESLQEKIKELRQKDLIDNENTERAKALKTLEIQNQNQIEEVNKSKANKKLKNETLNLLDAEYRENVARINAEYDKKDEQARLEKEAKIKAEQEKAVAAQQNINQQALAEEQAFNELQILNTQEGTAARLQAEIDLIQAKLAKELALTKHNENEKALLKKKAAKEIEVVNKNAADKEKDQEEKLKDYKINMAKTYMNAVSVLTTILARGNEKQQKAAFQIQKALNIADATMNTFKGVTKALAETTGDFTPTQTLRFANAAAVGLLGAAQVAAIASQKFEGGGSESASVSIPTPSTPSMPSAPTATPSMPQTRTEQGTFLNEQGQTTGRLDTRVYVLESDITNTQRDVNRVKTQSKV
jgi:hypothetical protein